MTPGSYREAIVDYIGQNAAPKDKFSHQARLYHLACRIAADSPHDDDVLFAAAWMHDLGVFVGHRPEEPKALAAWDWVAYALGKTPALLEQFGFPRAKIPAVLEAIRTHLPWTEPTTFEGTVLRDADLLEQLGAVGILRTVSKVGRDTRFPLFSDALRILRKNVQELPAQLRLDAARRLAGPRIEFLKAFLAAAEADGLGIDW